MGTKVHESRIKITGDTKRGVTAVNRVTGSLKKMVPSMRQVKIGAALMAAAMVGTTVAIVKMTTATAKAGDMFHKMSLRTGMSAQVLSELKHAAEISGASIEDVEKGIKTLSKRISDARFGLETYVRIFETLGVAYQTTSGDLRDVDDVMMDAIEGINNLKTSTEKMAMAQELFGKAGTKLLPLFKEGKEGIAALRAEARELGITFSDLEAKQSADLIDAMTRLKGSYTGLRNELGIELAPGMTDFFSRLSQYIVDNREEIVAFGKDFINSMASMAESLAIGGAKILDFFSDLGSGVREVRMIQINNQMLRLIELQKERSKEYGMEDEQLQAISARYQELHQQMAQLQSDQVKWATDPGLAEKIRALIDDLKNVQVDNLDKPTLLDKVLGVDEVQVDATMIKAQEALQRTVDQLQTQYDQLFLDEGERLDLWYSEMYEKVGEHEEGKYLLYQIYMEKKRLLNEKLRASEMKNADVSLKWEQLTMNKKLSLVSGGFNNMASIAQAFYQLSGQQSKTAFAVYKTFMIAQTVIDTARAAMGAYSAMSSIPYVGPVLGVIAAAAAIAAGAIQISRITSMQPGGSASVSSGGGGVSAPSYSAGAGYSPTYTPQEVVAEEDAAPASKTINIHIYGDVVDKDRYARELVEATQKALEDGV